MSYGHKISSKQKRPANIQWTITKNNYVVFVIFKVTKAHIPTVNKYNRTILQKQVSVGNSKSQRIMQTAT